MKKKFLLLALVVIFSMILGACAPKTTEAPVETEAVVEETEAVVEETEAVVEETEAVVEETEAVVEETEEVVEALPPGQELANAYAGMYAGTVVTMTGPFTDQDEVVFNDSVADFEAATGIDIQYEGTKEFEATINIRLDGGDFPDIVDYPQPGLLQYAVDQGYALDMEDLINPDWIKQNYSEAWQKLGTFEGPDGAYVAGIWARANGKSFVFYPKAKFDEYGYVVPTTWDEMMALTEQIAADGDTPWCIGIESGAATGWTMTDWIEDVLLRTAPASDYDAWVAGELPFDSPQINTALDYIEQIWFNDDYVYGGREAIPTISFGDAPKPMFEDPPQCWFNRQGNFITTFFPEEAVPGVDYDFFYFPTITDVNGDQPVLGAGDIYGVFNDRPEVRAVIQYFSTADSLKVWVEQGGAILPHKDADLSWYVDPITRRVAETIANATTFRFDGSDLMPAAVGQGTFWKYMTDYVSGSITREEALQQIDASWPE